MNSFWRAIRVVSASLYTLSGTSSQESFAETGWYIVGCGKIQGAQDLGFAEAQDKIREDLSEQRFNRLASDYVMKRLPGMALDGPIRDKALSLRLLKPVLRQHAVKSCRAIT